MPRKAKPKLTSFERKAADLRQRALRSCKGDREQTSSLLTHVIVELWSKSNPTDAARALINVSELSKRAALHQTTVAQTRALEAHLASAQTDEERESIVLAIRRLTSRAPSKEVKRINAIVQQHQLDALYEQRRHASTHDERRQIDEHIARLETAPADSG